MIKLFLNIILSLLLCTSLYGCSFFENNLKNDTPREWVKNNYKQLQLAQEYEFSLQVYHLEFDNYKAYGKNINKNLCEIQIMNIDRVILELKKYKQTNTQTIALQNKIIKLLNLQKKRATNFSKGYNDSKSTGSIADTLYNAGAMTDEEYSYFTDSLYEDK